MRSETLHGHRKGLHRLHGREDDLAFESMVHQIGMNREIDREEDRIVHFGNIFHRWAVLVSTFTGVPDAFTAQCRVNPLQTISWLSSLMMT